MKGVPHETMVELSSLSDALIDGLGLPDGGEHEAIDRMRAILAEIDDRQPLGQVPYLPRHNHAPEDGCEPGCPWHDWQAHVRQHGDPYPSAQTNGAGQQVEYARYLAVVTDLAEAMDVVRALSHSAPPWGVSGNPGLGDAQKRAAALLKGKPSPSGLEETVRAALCFLVTTRGGEPWITRALGYRSHGGEILVLTTGGYRTEDGTALPGETAGDSPERRALVAAHTELLRLLTTPPDHLVHLVAERIRTERRSPRPQEG